MAHEIEIFSDGSASFVTSNNRPEWHRLGVTLGREFTVEEGMRLARLGGWNVRKLPVQGVETTADGINLIDGEGKCMTVRDHPETGKTQYLGIVGSDYQVVQNEEAGEFLEALVDMSGAPLQTAGELQNGRKAFMTMKLPQHLMIGGVDRIDSYICVTTSHDGSAALTAMDTMVRVVCANTHTLAMGTADHIWAGRHTSGIKSQIQEARQALGLMFRYNKAFEAEAEKMIQATLAEGDFRRIAKEVIRPSDAGLSERQVRNTAVKLDRLTELFVDADTQANIRGTHWAGFQALTEWHEKESIIRYGDRDKATVRAERSITGGLSWFQNEAFRAFAIA